MADLTGELARLKDALRAAEYMADQTAERADRAHFDAAFSALARVEARLAAADKLAEIAAQYLDTGRGDLDGALAAYRERS